MENGSFRDDFPINMFIYNGFSTAMLNNQMVSSIHKMISPFSSPSQNVAITGFPGHPRSNLVQVEPVCLTKQERKRLVASTRGSQVLQKKLLKKCRCCPVVYHSTLYLKLTCVYREQLTSSWYSTHHFTAGYQCFG